MGQRPVDEEYRKIIRRSSGLIRGYCSQSIGVPQPGARQVGEEAIDQVESSFSSSKSRIAALALSVGTKR